MRYWKHTFVTVLLLCITVASAAAQTSEWQPATLVYESGLVNDPNLLADENGVLHLVWSGTLHTDLEGTPHSLIYAQFTEDGWSTPNDVVVMEVDVRVPIAAVDSQGIMHVVWGGQGINYSQVASWEAGSAANWSKPIKIGTGGLVNSPIGLEVGPDDTLHVVVAFADEGEAYYIQSPDAGRTWQAPKRISSSPQETAADVADLALAADGTLHAVWSRVEFPTGYPPVGVYYTSSTDNGLTWSIEQPLAGLDYGEPSLAIDSENGIHIAYNGRVGIGGKYHRYSSDGGITWKAATALSNAGEDGLNSSAELVADAEGNVYFIAGGDNNVYLSAWRNGGWGDVLNLRDTIIGTLAETERTSLKLLNGNQLHAVFENGKQQFWHTWRTLEVRPVTPNGYEVVDLAEEAIADLSVEELPEIATEPFLAEPLVFPDTAPTTLADPNDSLIGAILGAASVLGLAIVVQLMRQRMSLFR